jgi:hypothetical protein
VLARDGLRLGRVLAAVDEFLGEHRPGLALMGVAVDLPVPLDGRQVLLHRVLHEGHHPGTQGGHGGHRVRRHGHALEPVGPLGALVRGGPDGDLGLLVDRVAEENLRIVEAEMALADIAPYLARFRPLAASSLAAARTAVTRLATDTRSMSRTASS